MSGAAPTEGVVRVNGRSTKPAGRHWYSLLFALPTPVIFVAAAAVALLLLWRGGGLDAIGASVRAAHPGVAIGVLLVYASSIMILGIRWHTLVRLADGAPDWTTSAEVFLTSVVVNYAAPIGLAVPTRAALTVRDLRLSPGQSGAVVAWEAGLDIAALLVISGAWLVLGGSDLLQTLTVDARVIPVAAAALVVGMAAAVVAARNSAVRARAVPFFQRMISNPARRPPLALLAVALTAGFWMMQVGVMAALLQIFGAAPTVSLMLGLMGLPVLIGMLSPVPGGTGVREALMAAVARLDGVPAGPVVLAAVTYRLALFAVTPVVWGVVRLARGRFKSR